MRGLVAAIALVFGCGPRTPRVAPAPVVGPSPPYVLATASWADAPPGPPGTPPVAPALTPFAPAPPLGPAPPLATAPAAPPTPPPLRRHPFHEPLPSFARTAPALRLADLDDGACRAELAKRGLPVAKADRAAPGVAVPLRLTGPLRGVRVVTAPAPSPFGVCDCRLALALDELAGVLAPLGVAELRIGSMYRKGARIRGNPRRTSQHARGLAVDILALELADGRLLVPERDWHATVGDRSCGPDAVMKDPDDRSVALRNIYCAVAQRQLFHHMLSPSADRAHRDHLHFDLARDTKYRSVD